MDPTVGVEEIVAGHARLAGNTRGYDDKLQQKVKLDI
jgi:hypothetical protein